MEDEKGALRSKINILGLIMVLLGAVTDPMFRAYFGDWIPQEWFGRITFLAGWAVIYFRSNSQVNIPLDWRNPWKGEMASPVKSLLVFLALSASGIGMLIALQGCATTQAVRSGQTDYKSLAAAACSDMGNTILAASAMVAWTEPYFPNHKAEWVAVEDLLKQAEAARDAACVTVALISEIDSFQTLQSKKADIISVVAKINAAVARIKGVSSAEIQREYDDCKLGLEFGVARPLAGMPVLRLSAGTVAQSVDGPPMTAVAATWPQAMPAM